MSEIIKVILKAGKFKQWLDGKDINSDLLKEYYKEVTKETLIDKLPAKYIRWSLFTGAGIALDLTMPTGIGTVAGVALSAVDGLILDNLGRGWKPNQFVDQELKGLI